MNDINDASENDLVSEESHTADAAIDDTQNHDLSSLPHLEAVSMPKSLFGSAGDHADSEHDGSKNVSDGDGTGQDTAGEHASNESIEYSNSSYQSENADDNIASAESAPTEPAPSEASVGESTAVLGHLPLIQIESSAIDSQERSDDSANAHNVTSTPTLFASDVVQGEQNSVSEQLDVAVHTESQQQVEGSSSADHTPRVARSVNSSVGLANLARSTAAYGAQDKSGDAINSVSGIGTGRETSSELEGETSQGQGVEMEAESRTASSVGIDVGAPAGSAAGRTVNSFNSVINPESSEPRKSTPRARRMRLSVTHISPWSVAKMTFLLLLAACIIQVVMAGLVWNFLNAVGIFDRVTEIVATTGLDANGFNLSDILSLQTVLSAVTIFSVIELIVFTLLAVIVTALYNVISSIVGGVHITLGDD